MHELAVTESILEIATRHAAQANAQKITDLYLVIGGLSSIIDDSVQFYWDIISKDTIANGAKLHFRRIPTELRCQDCEEQFFPNQKTFTCPACESIKVNIVAGNEFFLESMNVE